MKLKSVKEENQFKWKTAVIVATMTTTVPQWKPALAPDASAISSWNTFIDQVDIHNKGHLEIYKESLISMGEALSALRVPTEAALHVQSKKIVHELLLRTEKKQHGYDRLSTQKRRRLLPTKK